MVNVLLGALVTGETVRILLSFEAFHSGAHLSSTLLACCVEIAKLVVAAVALGRGAGGVDQLRLHKPEDSLGRRVLAYVGFFVPALLYLVNNVLYLVGLGLGTPALLQAFVMSKLPLTAIVHHFALRPQKSAHAWVALCIIAVGLAETAVPSVQSALANGSGLSALDALQTPLLGLVIGFNSAAASIWTEKMLKCEAPFWVAQFYLYLFGAAFASVLAMVWDGRVRSGASLTSPPDDLVNSEGLTLVYYGLLVPLTAGVGFIVATILRQRDNLVKLVGSSACIVTVFIAQACFYPNLRDKTLDPNSVLGIGLLAIGTYAFNHFKDSAGPANDGGRERDYAPLPSTDEGVELRQTGLRLGGGADASEDSAIGWRRAWSPFFPPLACLGIVTTLLAIFHGDHSSFLGRDDPPSIMARALSRPAASVQQRLFMSLDSGAMVRLDRVAWPADADAPSEVEVVTLQRFCVEGIADGKPSRQYWLVGGEDEDVANVNETRPDVARVMNGAFHHGGEGHALGIKSLSTYNGSVSWINETTLLYTKAELGSHPASWMRVWSNYVTVAASGYEIFRNAGLSFDDYFGRFQLLDESFEPNSWARFLSEAARSAARASLPGGLYGSAFYPNSTPSTQLDSPPSGSDSATSDWHDASDFIGPEKVGLYCFDKALIVWQRSTYFRDSLDAELFRRTGLKLIGQTSRQPPSCQASDLRVVFLDRNRPVYNLDRLKEIVKSAGPTVTVRTISAEVPYDEQVRNFHDADILFSVHGSHLNNQLFMEPNSTLIEMFPHGFRHDEQRRLSRHTAVRHVELLDNPYPTLDEVRAVGGEEFVVHLERCQRLAAEFGDYDSCLGNYGCRSCHRSLGVKVDEGAFADALSSAIASYISSDRCSA